MLNCLFLHCLKGKKIPNLHRLIGHLRIIIMLKYLYLKKKTFKNAVALRLQWKYMHMLEIYGNLFFETRYILVFVSVYCL